MLIFMRAAGSETLKPVPGTSDDEVNARMVKYIAESEANGIEAPSFYRPIFPAAGNTDGDIVMRKLRLSPASRQETTVLTGGTFEDVR